MSVVRELARFVVRGSAASLPEAEQATQRRHVADTYVAAIAGSRTSEGRALRSLLPQASVADTIGLQAAVIRHTEIDDIHTPSCTTPSSVTVPTGLALARAAGDFDPERVASAIWVGTELMTRLGTALDGARVLYRGIWPTYFTAPLGAAAIAARIARLNEDQCAHALSLALMLTAGRSGRFHGKIPGRSVILAMAVANGVRAADAARQGVGRHHPREGQRSAALFAHDRNEAGGRLAVLDHRQRSVPDGARRPRPRAPVRHRARRCDEGNGCAQARRKGRDRG
jgi:2-methylcitrate dehydratase PrpD